MTGVNYPQSCRDCEEFETCPYPDLMTLLRDLSRKRFRGIVNISFEEGLPSSISRQEEINFIREL